MSRAARWALAWLALWLASAPTLARAGEDDGRLRLWHAWRELVPAVWCQVKDPAYFVERKLPTPTLQAQAPSAAHVFTAKGQAVNRWV